MCDNRSNLHDQQGKNQTKSQGKDQAAQQGKNQQDSRKSQNDRDC